MDPPVGVTDFLLGRIVHKSLSFVNWPIVLRQCLCYSSLDGVALLK